MPPVSEREAEAPFLVTLDVGTSSVRALLFDARARNVEGFEARQAYAMRTTPDGGVETGAEELAGRVDACLDELLARAKGLSDRLAGVACCTFWHSVAGVDGSGGALTPLITWADTRPVAEAGRLRERLDAKAYHRRTGAFFHPLYLPAKIQWLRAQGAAGVERWISFGEYLYRRYFGRLACTISMASGTGMLDLNAQAWDPDTLRAVGLEADDLSPLTDVRDAFRGLEEPWASRWPALRDVPWFPAVGDGGCSNLGAGCTDATRLALMIGTSGALRAAWAAERVEVPDGLWCYRADRRRVVLGAAFNDGGNLLSWCRSTLQLGEDAAVERELASMEPFAHGLTVLPFLAGERSPGWRADARAAIAGLSLNTSPIEILRAGLEAVALRFARGHDILRAAVPGADEIVASGGALLRSPAWMQIVADALGRPLRASAEPEGSCRGAALLALEALGRIGRLEELPAAFGDRVDPDPRRHGLYREALERQEALYRRLLDPA